MAYTELGWLKKLGSDELLRLGEEQFPGWDRDKEGNLYNVKVYFIHKTGQDEQYEILCWADDHSAGEFFSGVCYTEGGTPIIHGGDKVGLSLTFQKKEDAFAFKMRWV